MHLKNIRSHVQSTISFASGFNCLVGGLGCGKSSILYSIDFALFGEPISRSFEYLLREGSTSGTVSMQFSLNGKQYRIIRMLKRQGKRISQDLDELKLFEDGELIASARNDAIAEQIKTITGLDRELFREIVWVRQEHLKELLNIQPRERQVRLDELFGLSDYELAWSNLQIYQRDYETERKMYEKDPDVLGLTKLSVDYDQALIEFSGLEVELLTLAEKVNEGKKSLQEAEERLRKLEEIQKGHEELKRKEVQAAANFMNSQEAEMSMKRKCEIKRKSIDASEQRLLSMRQQISEYNGELAKSGLSPDQSIENLEFQIAHLDEQLSSLKAQSEATLRTMQSDTQRLTSISTESTCPVCLQSLDERYRNDLVLRIQNDNSARRTQLVEAQKQVEAMQKTKLNSNFIISKIKVVQSKVEELEKYLSDEENEYSSLSSELIEKQKTREHMKTELELIRSQLQGFDNAELDTAKNICRNALLEHNSLESEYRNKQEKESSATKRLDELKDRINQAQIKLEWAQKSAKIAELTVVMRDAYRSIQPKLRTEFVKALRSFVQQVLDTLTGKEGSLMNVMIDETYSPFVKTEAGTEREVANLSGGERTLVAFAYRLGLGQLIMQCKTGHGLGLILLDEPTESLGREDGSIDRLAEAIARFKAIEQVIAVTHSEAFADKAEHVIRLEKEAGESKITIER